MKTYNFQIITRDFSFEERFGYLSEIALATAESSADVLQLRNKNISSRNLYECAVFLKKKFKDINSNKKPLLIINDRPDIAHIAGADGVHVGQDDFPAALIKKFFPNLIIGVSAENAKQAQVAEKEGADYIGAGPVYPTSSKQDAGDLMTKENLDAVCFAVKIPVIAIGGVTDDKIEELAESGVRGAAVIGAISNSKNLLSAAVNFRKNIDKFFKLKQ